MQRAWWWVAAGLLGAARLGAQAPADSGARLFPLLDIGVARSLPTTLANRDVTGAVGADQRRESVRLRLDGQWGIIAEGRLPLGRAKVWGIEVYGARFRGRARLSAARQLASGTVPGVPVTDSVDYRLSGVTSWRGTLGVARAVPLPARLTGALLVGGTYGTVRSAGSDCPLTTSTSGARASGCGPRLDLTTPGVTVGADVFTREYHGLRLRASLKGDALRVDEAELRRSLRWTALDAAPLGEGGATWHMLPSFTVGVEVRIPL